MNRKKTQIGWQALLLIAVSSLLGFCVNGLRSNGIPFFQSGEGPTVPGIRKIDLAEARRLYDQGIAVFIDSRSKEEFERGHIRGAVNLPYEQFDEIFLDMLGGEEKDKLIVTYCSGEDCHSSDILADRIQEEGFTNLHVFFGGWPAWVEAKYPTSEIKPRPLYTLE